MDDLSNTNVLNSKRKAHAQSAPAAPPTASKRPRQQSLSPPEDPSNANLAMHPQQTVSFFASLRSQFGLDKSSASALFLSCLKFACGLPLWLQKSRYCIASRKSDLPNTASVCVG